MVRIATECDKIDLLVIDSLSGHLSAVADEVLVLAQLHELLDMVRSNAQTSHI